MEGARRVCELLEGDPSRSGAGMERRAAGRNDTDRKMRATMTTMMKPNRMMSHADDADDDDDGNEKEDGFSEAMKMLMMLVMEWR